MKVAIFQADTKDNEIESNLARYKTLLQGLDSDTDLLVLPEMFASGFTMSVEHAESMEGKGVRFMQEVAKEKHIAVEGSLLIKENGQYVNRHFFVTENSVQYYDKRHLFCLSKEPKVISRGEKPLIVEYKGWKIKLITCYDLRFPLWNRNKVRDGEFDYDLLVCVASWDDTRVEHWDVLLHARAIENQSYVVGVNRCGVDSKGYNYAGHSVARNFRGRLLAEAKDNSEEIVYVNLSKQELAKAREKFPVSEDWDSELCI